MAVALEVNVGGEVEAVQIRDALGALRPRPASRVNREEHGAEDRDDQEDDRQFQQGEGAGARRALCCAATRMGATLLRARVVEAEDVVRRFRWIDLVHSPAR